MRTCELIGLRWGDIDWHRKIANVSRAQVRHVEKGTKTHQVRDIDLNDKALAAQKPHSFMRGPDAVIFCSPKGKPWLSERRLREAFFRPCLPCLQHTVPEGLQHPTHLRDGGAPMGGANPAYVARQLGHANTAMLFKHYAKWIEGADQGVEASKSRAIFGGIGPKLGHRK